MNRSCDVRGVLCLQAVRWTSLWKKMWCGFQLLVERSSPGVFMETPKIDLLSFTHHWSSHLHRHSSQSTFNPLIMFPWNDAEFTGKFFSNWTEKNVCWRFKSVSNCQTENSQRANSTSCTFVGRNLRWETKSTVICLQCIQETLMWDFSSLWEQFSCF